MRVSFAGIRALPGVVRCGGCYVGAAVVVAGFLVSRASRPAAAAAASS